MRFYLLLFLGFFISSAAAQRDSTIDYKAQKNNLKQQLNSAAGISHDTVISGIYLKLAEIQEILNRPDSAVHYYLLSSRLLKKSGQMKKYSELQLSLGKLYFRLYNFKFAINALNESAGYFQHTNDHRLYVATLNLLGEAYSIDNQDILARRSFLKAYQVNSEILKDTLLLAENKTLMVQNDIRSKNYSRALKFALDNIDLSAEKGYDRMGANNLFYAGQLYSLMKNYANAVQYLERAETALKETSQFDHLPELYKLLAMAYVETGSTEKINNTLENYANVINLVKNTEIVKSSQEIAQKFDVENKDVLIKQLENENALKTLTQKQQQITIYGLLFAIIAVGSLVYLIYRNYRRELESNQIISQQRNELHEQNLKQIEKDWQINAMESMLIGQEAERNRIGKDLHDSLGAMLSTIKLQMSSGNNDNQPSMQKAKDMIDDACEEVRKISRDMMPITLSKYGLHTALEELVDKYTFANGPNVIYQAFGFNRQTNPDLDLFVYRITQELVNNCLKHAHAEEIIVQINYLEDKMIITVEDDGQGFIYDPSLYQGMGLKNIEYRVKYLKGNLSVDSTPGHGTITVIEIPVKTLAHNYVPRFSLGA